MSSETTNRSGALAGVRVIEIGGVGPGPFAGMLLADQGAEVIRIERAADAGKPSGHPVIHRGRRSIALDLKDPASVEAVLKIVESSDALIEGFRPGVAERLGLGPEICLERNPRLVYGRMTGFGQTGPSANLPGHDINYIAVTGALGAMGKAGENPPVPLNLVGDMGGGGILLAFGLTTAMLHARTSGQGQVVDAAMVDGTAAQLSLLLGLRKVGRWFDERGVNAFDGGAPYYNTYRTADGKFMAVGSVEPQFWACVKDVLGLSDEPLFAEQLDRAAWPKMIARMSEVFATRTRDEWAAAFDGKDSCVTPVFDIVEAANQPQNTERATYYEEDGMIQPSPAPRFLGTPAAHPAPAPVIGAHTHEVLTELGLDAETVERLAPRA